MRSYRCDPSSQGAHSQETTSPSPTPFYQKLDPHQSLPVEHPRKDGVGINSADYIHGTPNIHLSGVLKSSDSGSIWKRQGFGGGSWASTGHGGRRSQVGEDPRWEGVPGGRGILEVSRKVMGVTQSALYMENFELFSGLVRWFSLSTVPLW